MALINNFKIFTLQKKCQGGSTASGAPKDVWEDVGAVKVALYDTNQITLTQNVRYDQYDYAGLSFDSGFIYDKRQQNRIVSGENIYSVERANKSGTVSYLLLKKVDIHE